MACGLACAPADPGYQNYADRIAAAGDSAILAVQPLAALDSTSAITWNADAAAALERHAKDFAGLFRPDTAAALHRQMLDGLDSLVVAMQVLHEREERCGKERTPDCADAHDFGRILGSVSRGERIYLEARRRMAALTRQLGATMPPPPNVRAAR